MFQCFHIFLISADGVATCCDDQTCWWTPRAAQVVAPTLGRLAGPATKACWPHSRASPGPTRCPAAPSHRLSPGPHSQKAHQPVGQQPAPSYLKNSPQDRSRSRCFGDQTLVTARSCLPKCRERRRGGGWCSQQAFCAKVWQEVQFLWPQLANSPPAPTSAKTCRARSRGPQGQPGTATVPKKKL